MHPRVSFTHYTAWIGTILILSLGLLPHPVAGADAASAAESAADVDAYEHAKALSLAFRNAAKKVLPTVVTVETTTKPRPSEGGPQRRPPFQQNPFGDLFEDQIPGFGGPGTPRPAPNLGSGVIIDPSGVVLTNNHVVSGADDVVVQLDDGRRFKATDIKVDDKSDLAVFRIDSKEPLPAAKLGDSDKQEIGDWVLAIGNPYELERTVSAGIISAKGRSLGAIGRSNYLQTDAAINPGNSGGPLVNLEGEIVGINTAIFSRSGGNQGIGFAIPSNMAKWVVPQLLKTGSVHRAYLGVALGPFSAERAAALGVSPRRGVVVDRVFPDSPAAAAGLREKDVLLAFDGKPLETATDLQQAVERSPADSQHKIDLLREGKPLSVQVTLRNMPEDFGTARMGPPAEGNGADIQLYRNRELGLVVADLPPQVARQLGIDADSGVLVFQVQPESIAFRAGVRKGMVIQQVGQKRVKNVMDFKAAMEGQSLDDGITLQLQTPDGTETITLRSS